MVDTCPDHGQENLGPAVRVTSAGPCNRPRRHCNSSEPPRDDLDARFARIPPGKVPGNSGFRAGWRLIRSATGQVLA
jgi:hypothetical protein